MLNISLTGRRIAGRFSPKQFTYCYSRTATHLFSTAPEADEAPKKERIQMPKSKRLKDAPEFKEAMNVHRATGIVKERAWARFDESIEIAINLGVDPRKPNQSVKGMAKLPHGNGKKTRIGVFATGSDAAEAVEAGADVVGSDELVEMIKGGDVAFDAIIAHPSMMSQVAKIGRVRNMNTKI